MVVDLLRTLVGNDAAQMHDAVADDDAEADDAEALGTPVLHEPSPLRWMTKPYAGDGG